MYKIRTNTDLCTYNIWRLKFVWKFKGNNRINEIRPRRQRHRCTVYVSCVHSAAAPSCTRNINRAKAITWQTFTHFVCTYLIVICFTNQIIKFFSPLAIAFASKHWCVIASNTVHRQKKIRYLMFTSEWRRYKTKILIVFFWTFNSTILQTKNL